MRPPVPAEPPDAIDRSLIGRVVRSFYALVRRDALLGPIFNPRVRNWDEHEARITGFWASMILRTGEYQGTPMRVHVELPDLGGAHFDRWLTLFDVALASECTPEQAEPFQERAARIARSFQLAREAQAAETARLASGPTAAEPGRAS